MKDKPKHSSAKRMMVRPDVHGQVKTVCEKLGIPMAHVATMALENFDFSKLINLHISELKKLEKEYLANQARIDKELSE